MSESKVQRKLTAILCADVVGYSRLMGEDPEATLASLTESRQVFSDRITKFRGRIVNAPGDSILAEFSSVVDAVECSAEVQAELSYRNESLPEARRMAFRIGVNLGDVLAEGEELYGDGVNVAARLESLAKPGSICIAEYVFEQVERRLPVKFAFIGEHTVKNITKPLRVYMSVLDNVDDQHQSTGEKAPEVSSKSAPSTGPELPDLPSIAVLPFDNMSGDPEQEYFSDGICEDIITDLSKLSQLMVIARNSSFSYRGRSVDMRQVGKELGVRFLLEGSVRRAGDRVRINAQLIEASTGNHLWAERYDRTLEDIFAVQDEITHEIVTALDVNLVGGEQVRVWQQALRDPGSRELFYRGRNLFHEGTKTSILSASDLFEDLIRKEPESSLGYVWSAWANWWALFRGWIPESQSTIELVVERVKKAMEIDPDSAEAQVVLGILSNMQGKYEEAIVYASRALELNPNGAEVATLAAFIFTFDGQSSEGIRLGELSLRLSPVGQPITYNILGVAYRDARRFDEAIKTLKKSIAKAPSFLTARYALISTYVDAERDEEAKVATDELHQIDPSFSLETYTKRLPFRDKAVNDRLLKGLKRAGLI